MPTPLIDTVRLRLAVNHQQWLERQVEDFHAGRRNAVNKALASNFRRLSVEGAYGSKASIHSARTATVLFIECSLPRFLTGQNVFGSTQILTQVHQVVSAVLSQLGIEPTAEEAAAIAEGRIGLNRLDFTLHARFENRSIVRRVIRALKGTLAFTTKDFSCYGDETLYVGQHSKHWSLKVYDKEAQLKAKPLPADHPHREAIHCAAAGLLRVELTLHREGLRTRGWDQVQTFDAKAARLLLVQRIRDIEELCDGAVEVQCFEPIEALTGLQNALLASHHHGVDALELLPSLRAFKAHRQVIKSTTGIDLSIPTAVIGRVAALSPPPLLPYLVKKKSETERALSLDLGV